jgi:hypothetical protein
MARGGDQPPSHIVKTSGLQALPARFVCAMPPFESGYARLAAKAIRAISTFVQA